MIIDLLEVNKFIAANSLKNIEDPIMFSTGNIPTEGGLLSTDIFGSTMSERKKNFAYIGDLGGHFLHPFVYKMLLRMDRNIEHIVKGTRKFKIDKKGHLTEDDDGQTGINFLYNNWNKIKFPRNKSEMRSSRIDVIEGYGRNVVFVNNWPVIPAFYRDVNLQQSDSGKVSHHEINDLYTKLIRLSNIMKDKNTFDFMLINTQAMIQQTLVDIYNTFKGELEKKNGLIRKSLLGKSIDYGSRSVITAPVFQSNTYDEMEVDFYHVGVPMGQLVSLFTPFVVKWLVDFFRNELDSVQHKYPIYGKDGSIKRFVRLKDPASHFNEEYIQKAIDRFVHAPSDRFDKIELPIHESEQYKRKIYLTFAGRAMKTDEDIAPEDTSPLITRPATWTDVLYQCLADVTEDKIVWITRYPLLDYFGMLPNKITILSTTQTEPMYVGDKVYKRYPVVDLDIPDNELSVYFIDTVRMSNLYLAGLGGDYDGDQVTIKGVFTQEAQAEGERIMKSKAHILSIYGDNMRKTTNEGIQTIYSLTKFDNRN